MQCCADFLIVSIYVSAFHITQFSKDICAKLLLDFRGNIVPIDPFRSLSRVLNFQSQSKLSNYWVVVTPAISILYRINIKNSIEKSLPKCSQFDSSSIHLGSSKSIV